MAQNQSRYINYFTITLSVILISSFVNWEYYIPFNLPVISKHIEILALFCGWITALFFLIRFVKRNLDNGIHLSLEIIMVVIWLILFTAVNIVLYFIRINLFVDLDIKAVLWEQRLYFINIILSFLPWILVLMNTPASVFEKSINYVAAVVQILYCIHCVSVKSWYLPFCGKNRIDILYTGLIAFPVLVYGLSVGRLKRRTDQFLAFVNIVLCLLFSFVGTSRMAFVLILGELITAAFILWWMIKLHCVLISQIKCIVKVLLVGLGLTLFVIVFNIYDARGNISRSLSFFELESGVEFETNSLQQHVDEQYILSAIQSETKESGAAAVSPPALGNAVRSYWRLLAIENNLKSPIITSGRVTYTYISPTGVEYKGGAHNAIIDYWSIFGLPGLIVIGGFGVYLFIAQLFSTEATKNFERVLYKLAAITAEAVSFGFAMTQNPYLYSFTFMLVIMVVSWCRAMNREALSNL